MLARAETAQRADRFSVNAAEGGRLQRARLWLKARLRASIRPPLGYNSPHVQ